MVELIENIIHKTLCHKTDYQGEHEYITKKQNYYLYYTILRMIKEKGYSDYFKNPSKFASIIETAPKSAIVFPSSIAVNT